MNTQVSVTGMTVTTQVSNNLLIAPITDPNKGLGTTDMPAVNTYRTQYTEQINAKLEPVSTIDAKNGDFYYTLSNNVDAIGNAASEAYVLYNAASTDAFNTNYGLAAGTAVGYIDYVFGLQATNTHATHDFKISMTKCDLTYNGTDSTQQAFRVGLLVQDCTNASTASSTVTTKSILGTSTSAYFDKTGGTSNTIWDAVDSTSTLADVSNYNAAATVATVGEGEQKYYKVTVRLWLEGEDTTCTSSTFADLTSGWNLDLEFKFEDAASATSEVSNYTKVAKPAYTVASSAEPVSDSNKTFAGVTYYAYTSTGSATMIFSSASGAANSGTGRRWFTIDDSGMIHEITEFVTVS